MKAKLVRNSTGDEGTFGTLTISNDDGDMIYECHTGELPWKDNQQRVSCIPTGTYRCEMGYSPSFKKDLYHVLNVPGRSEVMIHNGNFCGDTSKGWVSHVLGCILVGAGIGPLENKDKKIQKAVFSSMPTLGKLMKILNNEPFELELS